MCGLTGMLAQPANAFRPWFWGFLRDLLRFGEVLWRRAERPQQAIGWYEKVRAEWPENEVALGALNELAAILSNGRGQ